ncbi:MAG: carotenoid oxygenase family protein [Oscillatoriaceae cyanobacterium Prado104]|jgi:carotenoid cleavage dioxygenase-like enzyme|nr:carotenoid oxygenase family protein [Oscillatoriaceae cyanobacterium Prado104]
MQSPSKTVRNATQEAMNQTFPRSVLSASRDEFGNKEDNPDAKDLLKMNVKDGELPLDLQGHVFIVAPVGSIDSPDDRGQRTNSTVYPSSDGTTPLYNGDGMIYRLDFDNLEAGAFLSSRLVKPPCYYADTATDKCQKYQNLKFKNYGITRLGALGVRNQLNTAFVPLKFSQAESERLLATWDVGRPYEIDPKTLETVTPVGRKDEWKEVTNISLPGRLPQPFGVIQTSAHPCFDPRTREMFTVNIGRSFSNIFSQLIPIGYIFKEFLDSILHGQKTKINAKEKDSVILPELETKPLSLCNKIVAIVESIWKFLRGLIGIFTDNFVYLMRWDGSGNLQKWEVRHNGFSIKIKQSIHQMAVTEDYIVLLDTAFKVSVEELLPTLTNKKYQRFEKLLRNFFDRPQLSDNSFYIIRRSDLKPEKFYVDAKKVTISGEAAHFLADYKNPGDLITLHLSHVCAWDAAEWISEFDFDNDKTRNLATTNLQRLYGTIAGPMDISKFGCHVVNGKKGELVKEHQNVIMDEKYTWGPAISTYQNHLLPDRLEDIYWICLGCWEDLKTEHMVHLYKGYKYREFSLESIDDITKQGRPSNLLRLHIAPQESVKKGENRLSIPDAYSFPDGYWVMSPQFVPRNNSGSSTDGYIVCLVHYGDGSDETNGNEIWIFDAASLENGPVCKLWHSQLNVAFTIHTTWLQKVNKRTATYWIDPQKDYNDVVQQQSRQVQDLFNKWVYPKQEPKTEADCQLS